MKRAIIIIMILLAILLTACNSSKVSTEDSVKSQKMISTLPPKTQLSYEKTDRILADNTELIGDCLDSFKQILDDAESHTLNDEEIKDFEEQLGNIATDLNTAIDRMNSYSPSTFFSNTWDCEIACLQTYHDIFLLSSVWDLNDNGIVGEEEASHVINTTIKQLEETRDILSNLQNVYRNDCESKTKYDNEHPTLGQQNALKSAKQYLQSMPFSYNGLIKQLKYEGYTDSEAEYGAKNCGADWYYQASIAAKNYLDIMPFSRKSLIEQLQYEGYTYEQAVYGVEQNGY